jgi:hypothetical protein
MVQICTACRRFSPMLCQNLTKIFFHWRRA